MYTIERPTQNVLAAHLFHSVRAITIKPTTIARRALHLLVVDVYRIVVNWWHMMCGRAKHSRALKM